MYAHCIIRIRCCCAYTLLRVFWTVATGMCVRVCVIAFCVEIESRDMCCVRSCMNPLCPDWNTMCVLSLCTPAGDQTLTQLVMSPWWLHCLCFGSCSPAVDPFVLLLYFGSDLHILANHRLLVLDDLLRNAHIYMVYARLFQQGGISISLFLLQRSHVYTMRNI